MKKKNPTLPLARLTLAASLSVLLTGCLDDGGSSSYSAAPTASGTTTLALQETALPSEVAALVARPLFHLAPVLLDPPQADDAAPQVVGVPAENAQLSTRRLTPQALASRVVLQAADVQVQDYAMAEVTPMATRSVATVYTPAQIRAAYALPALPANGSTLTAAQAAQLGAGQTIYIVDAMHDPNAAAELAAFNQKFGLPGCTTKTIAVNATLPLAAASTSGCEFSVVYNTASGTMTSTAPAYDSGWATEIALDLQWAHATAPLARIVLIEAADASINSLLGAIKLANAMGPGIVSMSFGAVEGNWTASVDSTFGAANMTYLAATGDNGAAVEWPSVSPKVVAVGGTTLSYSGSGARSEVAWSGTGGGTSVYTAVPSYQGSTVPGMLMSAYRKVADVAFNADPTTGQYVAVMQPGSTAVGWVSAGGTSLATPQWAGLIAIANATRAQAAKPALGAPHAVLYGQIASVAGTYASAFADVTAGSDGTCATCTAKSGYDPLTGLGTPNVTSLVSALAGASAPAVAPVVNGASISGKVGTALTFTVSVSASNPVTYALSGAPSGMSIASNGVVSWATPVAGTYSVTVKATDSKTGLSGQGTYTVTIAAAPTAAAPVVTSATIAGTPGKALSFTVAVSAANPVSYSMSGAPSGMSISSTGVVSWSNPVLGTYTVKVSAKDSKTSLSGQGTYTVKIANAGPVISAPALTGVAGKPLSGTIGITDATAAVRSISISGVPLGMSLALSGTNVLVSWPSPVAGSYVMTVVVTDAAGLSAQANVTLTITKQ